MYLIFKHIHSSPMIKEYLVLTIIYILYCLIGVDSISMGMRFLSFFFFDDKKGKGLILMI